MNLDALLKQRGQRRYNPFAKRNRYYCIDCRYATKMGRTCPFCQNELLLLAYTQPPKKNDTAGWEDLRLRARVMYSSRSGGATQSNVKQPRLKTHVGFRKASR